MKKYFLKDGDLKQGPFDLADLSTKSITTETAIWYEGLPEGEWTTAGKIEELKDLFTPVPTPAVTETSLPTVKEEVKPVVEPVAVEVKPVEPAPAVTTTAATATVAAATPTPAPKTEKPKPVSTGKKSTAWLSWVATLLILGGAGFFVYQDMEKNKTAGSSTTMAVTKTDTASTTNTSTTDPNTTTATTTDPTTTDTTAVTTTTTDPTTTTTTTDPNTTTTTTTTTSQQTAAQKKAEADKKAAAKKAEDDKKKAAALAAQKKAEADKKKAEDAKAAAEAREKDQRNRWMNYISFGKLNYTTEGDGIPPFDVPVYNGTDAMLDKVTVRIEYRKKEKKIYKTETITIYNIPARTTVSGKAPDSKRGEIVNVFITAINSKKLHFCYPQNNGNPDDPYFCN